MHFPTVYFSLIVFFALIFRGEDDREWGVTELD